MSERTTALGRPVAQYVIVGVRETLPTATADFKDQLTMLRGGSGVADKLYACRETSVDGTYEWVELTAVASHTHVEADITDFTHTHGVFQNFDVRAERNAVDDGGLTITSAVSQDVISDTQALSSNVTYDVFVWGHAQLSAGAGGFIEAAIDIDGTVGGDLWTEVWLGTGTEGGERGVMVYGVALAVPGGQTLTIKLVSRIVTANGTVGTASLLGAIVARGGGGVA